ncbi:MAG: glycosyltransferase 87 family protein [Actinomycetota bacterium]|nr:glycosyltransferase 87 family protein [Actinomycetota bacterium]
MIHSLTSPAGASSRSSRRIQLIRTLSLVALAGTVAYLICHFLTGPHVRQFDLKVYYNAIHFWTAGNDIYNYMQPDPVQISLGYTYPPLAAVLMWPMASLSLSLVTGISVLAIVATTAWCIYLSLRDRICITKHNAVLVVGLTTSAAYLLGPVRENLGFGQINMYLMALVMLDTLVLARRGSRFTGLGVGLAMAIKLTPGIFLLYFVLSKHWRPAVVAVCTAVVATLTSAVVMPGETWQYFTSLVWDSTRVGVIGVRSNQSLDGLITRIAGPDAASTVIWLVLVLVIGTAAAVRIRKAAQSGDTLSAIAITGLLGVLVSPVSWTHHIVWIIPAAVVTVHRLFRGAAGRAPGGLSTAPWWWHPGRRAVTPVALIVLGALAFGLDLDAWLRLPEVDFSNSSVVAMVVASNQMFWVLAAIFLLPIGIGSRSPAPQLPPPRRLDDATGAGWAAEAAAVQQRS